MLIRAVYELTFSEHLCVLPLIFLPNADSCMNIDDAVIIWRYEQKTKRKRVFT
jgi:hypothetical protein